MDVPPRALRIVIDDSTSVAQRGVRARVTRLVADLAARAARDGIDVKWLRFPSDDRDTCAVMQAVPTGFTPVTADALAALRDGRAATRAFTPLDEALERTLLELAREPDAVAVIATDGWNTRATCHGATIAEDGEPLPDGLVARLVAMNDKLRFVDLGVVGNVTEPRTTGSYLFAQKRVVSTMLPLPPAQGGDAGTLDPLFAAARRQLVVSESSAMYEASWLGPVQVGSVSGTHCSGVVVGPREVLTARHCLPATHLRIEERGASERDFVVVAQHEHPDPGIDAAILVADADLGVRPPPRRRALETAPPLGRARHIGFGAAPWSALDAPGARHAIDLMATGWRCDGPAQAARSGCRPGVELVIPGNAGADTCDGDSGGPLFELVEWPEARRAIAAPDVVGPGGTCEAVCEWRVVGITSRPVADAEHRCGDGGIYVRADRLAAWIDAGVELEEDGP